MFLAQFSRLALSTNLMAAADGFSISWWHVLVPLISFPMSRTTNYEVFALSTLVCELRDIKLSIPSKAENF